MKVREFISYVMDKVGEEPDILNQEIRLTDGLTHESYYTHAGTDTLSITTQGVNIAFNTTEQLKQIQNDLETKYNRNGIMVLNAWAGLYNRLRGIADSIKTIQADNMDTATDIVIKEFENIKADILRVSIYQADQTELISNIDIEISFKGVLGDTGIRAFIDIRKSMNPAPNKDYHVSIQQEFYGTIPQEDSYFEDIDINNLLRYTKEH